MSKILSGDWLQGSEQIVTNFENKQYQGPKGQILVELQKSYKGDKRFQLDKRFKNDVDVERLPNNFKQMNQDLLEEIIDKQEIIVKDVDLKEEVNAQLNILQGIMPEHRAFISYQPKPAKKKYDLIIKHFDPTQIDKRLYKKKNIIPQKNEQNVLTKGETKIQKGIDKTSQKIQRANSILQKTLQKENEIEPKVQKKLKINSQQWKDVIQKKENEKQNFTLFS